MSRMSGSCDKDHDALRVRHEGIKGSILKVFFLFTMRGKSQSLVDGLICPPKFFPTSTPLVGPMAYPMGKHFWVFGVTPKAALTHCELCQQD